MLAIGAVRASSHWPMKSGPTISGISGPLIRIAPAQTAARSMRRRSAVGDRGAVLNLRAVQPADVQIARSTAAVFTTGMRDEDPERGPLFRSVLAQTLLQRCLTSWEGIGNAQGEVMVSLFVEMVRQVVSPPFQFRHRRAHGA